MKQRLASTDEKTLYSPEAGHRIMALASAIKRKEADSLSDADLEKIETELGLDKRTVHRAIAAYEAERSDRETGLASHISPLKTDGKNPFPSQSEGASNNSSSDNRAIGSLTAGSASPAHHHRRLVWNTSA
ncbi:MAG: hypothetical protein IT210_17960 [Armatimonadetes bacterium]|nr:hypothetical protein [Armatimonadota bacterium]